jgi:glycosyltransferase involved in cell wall biosynthesis
MGCFYNQTYDFKELVVIYEDSDELTDEFLRGMGHGSEMKIVKVSGALKSTLGELRNISVEKAAGAFVCQWDDDDWYHPERLEYQYRALSDNNSAASILTRWVMVDTLRNKAYLSDSYLWEGSLLCERSLLLKKRYPKKRRGEDSSVIAYLYKRNSIYLISRKPTLYIYIYHGKNTWNYKHWEELFNQARELSQEKTEEVFSIINRRYQ